jgi:hypothetical protein
MNDETNMPVRGHVAFLNSYAPDDEALYDDVENEQRVTPPVDRRWSDRSR